jgi:hypothetical protein
MLKPVERQFPLDDLDVVQNGFFLIAREPDDVAGAGDGAMLMPLLQQAQSGRADLALSAQPLARQYGVYQPGRHHGCLRDGLEPVRHQPRPDPLALRGRLGSGFARSIAGTYYVAEIEPTLDPEISGDPYYVALYALRLLCAGSCR